MSGDRVVELAVALGRAADWRAAGRHVGLILGAFDVLNAGHVRAVGAALRAADRLVAAVRDDAGVARALGEGRPVLQAEERACLVAALRDVDLVVIVDEAALASLAGAIGAPVGAERGEAVGDTAGGAEGGAVRGAEDDAPGGAVIDVVARVRALHGHGGAGP